ESDRGQVHAINKCRSRATGEFFNWINSDDVLAPNALFRIAQAAGNCDLVAGACYNFDSAGNRTQVRNSRLSLDELLGGAEAAVFHQPAVWWRREWLDRCGGLDGRYDLAFDYDLLLRYLGLNPRIVYVPEVLAHFRLHPRSKTCSRARDFGPERERILEELAAHAPHTGIRKACRRRLRQLRWWRQVAQMSRPTPGSRMSRATGLLLKALADPALRVNRFTLGAVRKILSGRSAGAPPPNAIRI
ncbi:MAG: glycosyltransferase, partial [Limisphaerales bacterium]